MFDDAGFELFVNFEPFKFVGFRTSPVRSRFERACASNEVYSVLSNIYIPESVGPKVFILTEHLANFWVVLLIDADFDIFSIDGFVSFTDGHLPGISEMLIDNIDVSSRLVAFVVKGLGFDNAEHFATTDCDLHEGDWIFGSFSDRLTFR